MQTPAKSILSQTFSSFRRKSAVLARSIGRTPRKIAKRMTIGGSRRKNRSPLHNNNLNMTSQANCTPLRNNCSYMTSQAKANTSNNNNSGFVTSQENRNSLCNKNLNMTSQVNNDPLFNNASGGFRYEGMDNDFDKFMSGLTVCLRTKFYLRF